MCRPTSLASWLLPCFLLRGAMSMAGVSPPVRIGVFGLFQSRELVVQPSSTEILKVEGGGEVFALEGTRQAVLVSSGDDVLCRVEGRTVYSRGVVVRGTGAGGVRFRLEIPDRIRRDFDGVLEVRSRAGVLIPVIALDLEVAVASAVAAESLPETPMEALKAQAVVARSFYAAARGRHPDFDFCDTTHCQFFRSPPGDSQFASAAAETQDLILAYRRASFAALYSQSCGGRTRTPTELGMISDAYPYYSVRCAYCERHAVVWKRRIAVGEARGLIGSGPSERERLLIARKFGWDTIPGNNFRAEREGGEIILQGRGAGHGVGLCQSGAAGMARAGAGYVQILSHYYPNCALAELRSRAEYAPP